MHGGVAAARQQQGTRRCPTFIIMTALTVQKQKYEGRRAGAACRPNIPRSPDSPASPYNCPKLPYKPDRAPHPRT